MEILQLENVTYTYAQASKPSLSNIDIQVREGDFVVLCGQSGCGKSTLLRLLKPELTPKGTRSGDIRFKHEDLTQIESIQLVEQIAIVMQDPDYQIVFDDTLQELVFALENIGLSSIEIKKRVAELVHYFSAQPLLAQTPSTMSGGQKQTINLLSALLLKPSLLLLDEPTAQLDPIAAKKFIAMLKQLNEETGMTIIIAEHHTEQLFEVADHVIMLEQGQVKCEGTSEQVVHQLLQLQNQYIAYVPQSIQFLYEQQLLQQNAIPFTLKGSKKLLQKNFTSLQQLSASELNTVKVIDCHEVYTQYDKNTPFILKKCTLTIFEGEIFMLLGGNGSGKSTWLKALIGSIPIVRGKIKIHNIPLNKIKQQQFAKDIRYLPQNPKTYFTQDTIEQEMYALIKQFDDNRVTVDELLGTYKIKHLRNRHPHDCSGGELQRAALACLQIGNPKILLLDEPTKGLDPIYKNELIELLKMLQKKMTIVCVTHDVQFTAQCATRCGILFEGEVTAIGKVDEVLKNNYFYTTPLNRLTKTENFEGFLTVEEARSSAYEIFNK